MIKMLLVFFAVFIIIASVSLTFRELSSKEKWQLTKVLFWTTICSVVSVGVLGLIVFIF